MTAKKRKFWNIPPEEEQTGLLLWFQILQKHYLKLFGRLTQNDYFRAFNIF